MVGCSRDGDLLIGWRACKAVLFAQDRGRIPRRRQHSNYRSGTCAVLQTKFHGSLECCRVPSCHRRHMRGAPIRRAWRAGRLSCLCQGRSSHVAARAAAAGPKPTAAAPRATFSTAVGAAGDLMPCLQNTALKQCAEQRRLECGWCSVQWQQTQATGGLLSDTCVCLSAPHQQVCTNNLQAPSSLMQDRTKLP